MVHVKSPLLVLSLQERPVYAMSVALYIFAVIFVGVLVSVASLSFVMWPVTFMVSFQSITPFVFRLSLFSISMTSIDSVSTSKRLNQP